MKKTRNCKEMKDIMPVNLYGFRMNIPCYAKINTGLVYPGSDRLITAYFHSFALPVITRSNIYLLSSKDVNGTAQIPFSGTSFLYSFDSANAATRHSTQYFEMFGNRAIYHGAWVACTRHSIPCLMLKNIPLSDDVWELYNVNEDFSQANNLAAQNPEKLKELQKLFFDEATKNHVFPIDDRRSERFDGECIHQYKKLFLYRYC
jgi:hypothetical protein